MTAVTFDVRDLAPMDRAEALRAAVGPSVLWVDVDHHPAIGAIAARGLIRRVGGLTQFSARTTPLTIRRTARQTRDGSEARLILAVQRSGTATVAQYGRQAVVRPGDLVLVDSSRPFTAVNANGTHHHYFCVPRARLALPDRLLGQITATRLGPANPVAALAAAHLSRLADSRALPESPAAQRLDRSTVELVRAVITTQLGAADLARGPLDDTLALRIMEHVRFHADDPALSAARIAGEFGISVRHLYAVLARSGIELGEWIRARRLEACRADLADPHKLRHTVASVARGRGFADASHFGRLFKEAYGISPGEWRARHHPGDGTRT
ncbi:helix-turn-helix domain-containing protein [Streptomyces sp. NPDC058464]|uniref:helix-turn-helix domain-containing protein n=1 Tax=Streptomyces sp. NPDC058464 TaxID=3346511 RepID=UPI003650A722